MKTQKYPSQHLFSILSDLYWTTKYRIEIDIRLFKQWFYFRFIHRSMPPCKYCGTNGNHYCPHDVAKD